MKYPNVGIATIYRNLEQLSTNNTIVKLNINKDIAHYDGNIEPHFHIICSKCGKIEDVWFDHDLMENTNLKKILPNFEVLSYNIDMTGICKDCK